MMLTPDSVCLGCASGVSLSGTRPASPWRGGTVPADDYRQTTKCSILQENSIVLSKRNMTTAACTVALVATVALAETPTARRNAAATATLSLTGGGSASAGNGATTAVTMEESGDDWDISGPIFMRSATPEPPV